MKYIFCSSIYNMEDYDEIARKSKDRVSLADHNFNYNIIVGLETVLSEPITLVNNVPISSYPKFPRIFFHRQTWKHTDGAHDLNCGFINLLFIKHCSRAITTFLALKKEIRAAGETPVCVMTYDLHPEICLAICWAQRVFPKIHTCAVLPDLPTAMIAVINGGRVTVTGKLRAGIKMKFIGQFDAYVPVTEYIKDVVVAEGKPVVVIEGIYNNRQLPLPPKTINKKVIFYSGLLSSLYGIENLLEAFQKIYERDQNYALWICGGGELEEKLHSWETACPGIKYYGYVSIEQLRNLQAEATVFVNPKQNSGMYARYSFPSKTMEYLASGRPVVGYKLDCIPKEYDEYIHYVPDHSVEALQAKLVEICELPEDVREAFGQKARKFILEQKNPKIQCQKLLEIVKMWNTEE